MFVVIMKGLRNIELVGTGSRSTFEFPSRVNLSGPIYTVPSSMDNKVDAVRLYASHRLNLLLLKGQRCMLDEVFRIISKRPIKKHGRL